MNNRESQGTINQPDKGFGEMRCSSLRDARKIWKRFGKEICELFSSHFTAPTGGLINARVVRVENGCIVFRCHYDNYDNDDDSWELWFDPRTGDVGS
jgi:hypothetical protein